MSRHAIGRERAGQRTARPPRAVARQYGGASVTWHQHAAGFGVHPLHRVNSSGSSVTGGGRQRRDQAARSH